MIGIGDEIPSAQVAVLNNDMPLAFDIRDFLRGKRALLVGVPQAFTPVCSREHIPGIVAARESFRAHGIDEIAVIAPDNPWTMAVWKEHFPGAESLTFLSDAESGFIAACGLTDSGAAMAVGNGAKRFVMRVDDLRIRGLTVEDTLLSAEATGAAAQLGALAERDPSAA